MNLTLLSDLELARARWPELSDTARVVRLADATIADLELQPPIDPHLLASFRGVTRVEEVVLPWAGCLSHDNDETVIRVRSTDATPRQRFTICHEVEHTYLPGFAVRQYRCDPSPAAAVQNELENLADVGASELLMPRRFFAPDVAGPTPNFDLVAALADRYESSLTATALRTSQLANCPTVVVSFELGTKPSAPTSEPRLRVRWSRPQGRWPYIPRHKSVEPSSLFGRALEGEMVDEMATIDGLARDDLSDVFVSARPAHYIRGHDLVPRVLALISRPTDS